MGRKKSEEENTHVARPLASLQDPGSFAPPPKRRGTGLAPAPPPVSMSRKVITAPSKYQDPRAAKVEPPVGRKQPTYDDEEPQQVEEPEEQGPQPYRMNTTGFSTAGFSKPPGRRDGADGRSPPPYSAASAGPPSLPPRLPPRTNSASSTGSAAPSPAPSGKSGYLNQGAMNRLGAAGVSVPGFGIGRSSPASTNPTSPPPPARPNATPSHMNELQTRFSKLGTSATPAPSEPPAQGTTWAQKQAAFKTASSFQKDPSSVSFADAKAAASTANNFRQRHGEQVATGLQTANNLNQKYGVADRVSGLANNSGVPAQTQNTATVPGLAGKKKPPPPPPKKKPGLGGGSAPAPGPSTDDGPPPIPMSTRPQF